MLWSGILTYATTDALVACSHTSPMVLIYVSIPVTQAQLAPSNSCQHIKYPNSRSIRFLHQFTTTHVLTLPSELSLAAFMLQRTVPRLSDLHASTLAVVATSGSLPDAQERSILATTCLPVSAMEVYLA